jgi:hypothetical protein
MSERARERESSKMSERARERALSGAVQFAIDLERRCCTLKTDVVISSASIPHKIQDIQDTYTRYTRYKI